MEKYSRSNQGQIQLPITDKTVITEISDDFTLPDYQPEIKRLLKISASVLPPSKYIGDKDAEFAGNIDYYVLYTGSDNELYCVPLSAEYKVNLPFERNEAEENDGFAINPVGEIESSADMISGRVTAPRKISVKCRLKSRARIFGEMVTADSFGEGDDSIQVLRGEARVSRIAQGISELVRVSDEMICDNREGDVRVITAEGRVMMNEITSGNGSISCRGDVYLKLLLVKDDGSCPYTASRKIPFACSVPLEVAESGCGVCGKGTVCEMNINVEEGRIGIDVGIIAEFTVCKNESVAYVKDVYSTDRKTENYYKDITVFENATAICGNFTLSDSLSLEGLGFPAGAMIIDVSGIANADEYAFEDDRCIISGKAKFSLLGEKDGEYSVTDIELPFSYRPQFGGYFDRAICSAEVLNARARVDGERVGIDAEIFVSGNVMRHKNERMLADTGFGEEIARGRGEYVVCYPSESDTLWSVAKSYGITVEGVARANGIDLDVSPDSKDSLKDMNYLIV